MLSSQTIAADPDFAAELVPSGADRLEPNPSSIRSDPADYTPNPLPVRVCLLFLTSSGRSIHHLTPRGGNSTCAIAPRCDASRSIEGASRVYRTCAGGSRGREVAQEFSAPVRARLCLK